MQAVASELPASITDRFDIVGWDPRGTGSSAPVDCGKHLDYLFDVDTAPDDPAEQAALDSASRRFAQDCASRSGDLLAHIASIDTVHDLDRIRAALGDDKLTYAGFSYGTYLGALYAQQYPDKVRALLLDGAVDPAVPVDEVSIQQAKGFEASLGAFLDDCARRTSCAFHHGGNPRRALDALGPGSTEEPIPGDDGRTLGPTQLDIALAAPLYSGAGGYRVLATALQKADRGDPSAMLRALRRVRDARARRHLLARVAGVPRDLVCRRARTSIPRPSALQARAAHEAPYFGASNVGLGLPCSYWPVPPVNPVADAGLGADRAADRRRGHDRRPGHPDRLGGGPDPRARRRPADHRRRHHAHVEPRRQSVPRRRRHRLPRPPATAPGQASTARGTGPGRSRRPVT